MRVALLIWPIGEELIQGEAFIIETTVIDISSTPHRGGFNTILLIVRFVNKLVQILTPPQSSLRACLHRGGGPRVGEVTRLDGVTRLSI